MLAHNGRELRDEIAVRLVAVLGAGVVARLAAVLLAPWLLAAVVRYVRWELALGALWADAERVAALHGRIPREDLRASVRGDG